MLFTGGFTAATTLGCICAGALHSTVRPGSSIAIGLAFAITLFLTSSLAAFVSRKDKAQTLSKWLDIVVCAGTRNLRTTFKRNPTRFDTTLHIVTFDICLKYFCPPILLTLFVNQAISDATEWDRGYKNYPLWVQLVAGVGVLGTMLAALIIFTVWPSMWDTFGGKADEARDLEAVMREMVRFCARAQRNAILSY
jgi:hypothetical protein